MPEDSELAEFILATILGIFGAFVLGNHLVLLSLREQQIGLLLSDMTAPLFQNPRALANDGPRIRAATTDDSLNSCPVMRRAVGVDSAHPTDLTLLNQTSELPPETDINTAGRHVSKVPTGDMGSHRQIKEAAN